MADKDNSMVIRIPVPRPGNLEKVDLSFLRETFPKSEEERARRANTPLTPEEIDAYIDALCPPSLQPPEDEKG